MTPRRFIVFGLALMLASGVCFAKKHPKGDKGGEPILEIDPGSITLDVGNGVQQTYAISSTTKSTVDGNPVAVDSLQAGMLAKVTASADGKTANDRRKKRAEG